MAGPSLRLIFQLKDEEVRQIVKLGHVPPGLPTRTPLFCTNEYFKYLLKEEVTVTSLIIEFKLSKLYFYIFYILQKTKLYFYYKTYSI